MNEEVKEETTLEETSTVEETENTVEEYPAVETTVGATEETVTKPKEVLVDNVVPAKDAKPKSKKKIVIIAILGVVLLAIVGILLYVLVFSKKANMSEEDKEIANDPNAVVLKATKDGDFRTYYIEKYDHTKNYILETKDRINFNTQNYLDIYINGEYDQQVVENGDIPKEGVYIYTYSNKKGKSIVFKFTDTKTVYVSSSGYSSIGDAENEATVDKNGITYKFYKINKGIYTNQYGNQVDLCVGESYTAQDIAIEIMHYINKNGKIKYDINLDDKITVEQYLKENDKDKMCANRETTIRLYKTDTYYNITNKDVPDYGREISSYTCTNLLCKSKIDYDYDDDDKKTAYILDGDKLYYYHIGTDDSFKPAVLKTSIVDTPTKIKTNIYKTGNKEYYISFYNNTNDFDAYQLSGIGISYTTGLMLFVTEDSIRLKDINTNKVVFEEENENVYYGSINNNNSNFITISYNEDEELILTKDYKKIGYYPYYLRSEYNNKLYAGEKNTYSIYDTTGNELYKSKEFKTIYNVTRDYVSVITNDNRLQIIKAETEEVVADFGEWKNTYKAHPMISGEYEEEGKKGIYLVVADSALNSNDHDYDDDEGFGKGYEFYYAYDTGEVGKIETYIGGYAKPVLYLYPEEDNTKVSVKFEKPGLLTTTYPKYDKVWNVTVNKDGNMKDAKGKTYYALYWEEEGNTKVDFSEGFYVTKDNASSFLEEKLAKIGLTEREANEFIMYWLPILEKNKKNLVYFELTESREKYNKLLISPQPDSLLRVAIHIKKVDKKTSVKEQKLTTFKRNGFTAVEWGGTQH